MIQLRDYADRRGRVPFREWLARLDEAAAARTETALYRMGLGNFSNVRGVGAGVFEYKINFGPGYRVYFGKDGDEIVILLGAERKLDSAKTFTWHKSVGVITRSERAKQGREKTMPLTKDHRQGVRAMMKKDAAFRREMLGEALESLIPGETSVAREILRDYINATLSFPKLAAGTKIHVKTLHQMFGPNGNPTANNLFEIIGYLQRAEGVRFEVRPVPIGRQAKKRPPSRRTNRAA